MQESCGKSFSKKVLSKCNAGPEILTETRRRSDWAPGGHWTPGAGRWCAITRCSMSACCSMSAWCWVGGKNGLFAVRSQPTR